MPKVTLQEMLKTCMAQVIAAYEKLTEEKQIKVGTQMFSQTDHIVIGLHKRHRMVSLTNTGPGPIVLSYQESHSAMMS